MKKNTKPQSQPVLFIGGILLIILILAIFLLFVILVVVDNSSDTDSKYIDSKISSLENYSRDIDGICSESKNEDNVYGQASKINTLLEKYNQELDEIEINKIRERSDYNKLDNSLSDFESYFDSCRYRLDNDLNSLLNKSIFKDDPESQDLSTDSDGGIKSSARFGVNKISRPDLTREEVRDLRNDIKYNYEEISDFIDDLSDRKSVISLRSIGRF